MSLRFDQYFFPALKSRDCRWQSRLSGV